MSLKSIRMNVVFWIVLTCNKRKIINMNNLLQQNKKYLKIHIFLGFRSILFIENIFENVLEYSLIWNSLKFKNSTHTDLNYCREILLSHFMHRTHMTRSMVSYIKWKSLTNIIVLQKFEFMKTSKCCSVFINNSYYYTIVLLDFQAFI